MIWIYHDSWLCVLIVWSVNSCKKKNTTIISSNLTPDNTNSFVAFLIALSKFYFLKRNWSEVGYCFSLFGVYNWVKIVSNLLTARVPHFMVLKSYRYAQNAGAKWLLITNLTPGKLPKMMISIWFGVSFHFHVCYLSHINNKKKFTYQATTIQSLSLN